MPHHDPDHRVARAAGKATRAFLDGRKQDADQARALREERAEAEARLTRQAQERRRARTETGGAVALRTARWWWAAVTVAFALLTVSFIVAGASQLSTDTTGSLLGVGRTEQYVLAAVTGVLTLATGTGAVQLFRGRRSAVGLLTAIAVIAGVPLIVRGHPLLIVMAVVLLAGAALLWLPPVRSRLRAS